MSKIRALQAKKAETVAAMRAITNKAEAENRDLTDAETTEFSALAGQVQSLQASIDREQSLAVMEAGLAAAAPPPVRGEGAVEVAAAAVITTQENAEQDPTRGFRSMGDFARAVAGLSLSPRTGAPVDRRIQALMPAGFSAAAPSNFAGEGVGADGGVLVPPSFGRDVWNLAQLEEQSLLPLCDDIPVEGNSMSLPKDETTPWGSNGVRAYWQGEALAGTPTKPVLGRSDLKLKKLLALVPASEELMADATALGAYLPAAMARSIRWKSDEAVLFGTGAGQPLGAYASGAAVTVAKDSGQATLTLSATNLANMVSRLLPGSYGRSIWVLNNDVLPALFTLTLGGYPIYLPAGAPIGGIQGSPYGSLLGRPIMVSQHAKSFSSEGDVMLMDLKQYQTITKSGGLQTATSMHLYFDADAVAFRVTFRVDGQPKMVAPVTPANGSNTLSPFIKLGAR